MATARISKRSVDALTCQPGRDRTFLWDEDLAGFAVGVFPTGRKFYVAQYRQAGRTRRITIGEHGRLTPDEARRAAKKLLGAIESGADPIADRQALRTVPTFTECADAFMAQHAATKLKLRTIDSYQALLRSHIRPSIGDLRITEIRRAHVSKLHHSLAATPGAANRTIAAVSAMWNWTAAERDDLTLPPNPCKGIKRNPEEGRERFLSVDELARLGEALAEAGTVGLPYEVDETNPKSKHAPKPENRRRKIDPYAIAAIWLLILSGARLNEILTAQWSFVDFARGLLNLPTSKTGKKCIFLSAAALAILAGLPRIEGNPHVIPGDRDGAPRSDLKKPWAAVRSAAGLEGLRLHDLRHSFASVGAGGGLGLPIIGKLLGHSQPATTARYAHLDADPMRRAVDTIGNTISAAMNRKPAEIVSLTKRSAG
jgi:integrase